MRRFVQVFLAVGLLTFTGASGAQEPAEKSSATRQLDIYFVDSEGGQITLFVAPSGQSMLVDTGFAGKADRIMAVLKEANVNVLDYVVITHYHGDHVGSAAER